MQILRDGIKSIEGDLTAWAEWHLTSNAYSPRSPLARVGENPNENKPGTIIPKCFMSTRVKRVDRAVTELVKAFPDHGRAIHIRYATEIRGKLLDPIMQAEFWNHRTGLSKRSYYERLREAHFWLHAKIT